jgi:hypothetical protein
MDLGRSFHTTRPLTTAQRSHSKRCRQSRDRLRAIAPALMQDAKLVKGDHKDRLAELTALLPKARWEQEEANNPGLWEFRSSRDPYESCRVTYGRVGHLECTSEGFLYRGN